MADARRNYAVFKNSDVSPSYIRLLLVMLSPRFAPVLLCRLAHSAFLMRLSPIGKIISLINFVIFGIEIAIQCPIGKGLILPHTHGTVIGASAIGENVTIFQGVTLGAKELDAGYDIDSRPVISNGVILGAGSKILGNVLVGESACIGANAVVLESIPNNAIAAGIPAKVVKINDNNR